MVTYAHLGLVRGGVAGRDVPRAPVPELLVDGLPGGLFHGRHHLQHADALARPQVVHEVPRCRRRRRRAVRPQAAQRGEVLIR